MKDKLDRIIIENKVAFDEKEVSEKLWGRIEADLKSSKAEKNYNWLWKVAAVVFIGTTLVLLMDKFDTPKSSQLAQYEGYNQELIDVEAYYVQQISFKKIALEASLSESEKGEFINELNDLDNLYSKLKTDLGSNQNNNKLISAMIQNLQLRVEILNRQLHILERINKGRNNEKIII